MENFPGYSSVYLIWKCLHFICCISKFLLKRLKLYLSIYWQQNAFVWQLWSRQEATNVPVSPDRVRSDDFLPNHFFPRLQTFCLSPANDGHLRHTSRCWCAKDHDSPKSNAERQYFIIINPSRTAYGSMIVGDKVIAMTEAQNVGESKPCTKLRVCRRRRRRRCRTCDNLLVKSFICVGGGGGGRKVGAIYTKSCHKNVVTSHWIEINLWNAAQHVVWLCFQCSDIFSALQIVAVTNARATEIWASSLLAFPLSFSATSTNKSRQVSPFL